MTQSLCGNCGTGLQYGVGWCPGCGMAVGPVAPPAPAQPAFPPQQMPGQPPYPQAFPGAAGQAPYPQAGYAPSPYGMPPYGAGQNVSLLGKEALEALLAGDWAGAAKSAVLAVVAMLGVSLVGMLLVAGGEFGFGETMVLVLGGVCLAVGGDAFIEASTGSPGFGSEAEVGVGVLPLTVTLVGMLVLGVTFGRRLRARGVTRGRDVLLHLVRTSLVFALFFIPLSLLARYTPDPFDDGGLADLVDARGEVGVGVWTSVSGALLFAVAATGLVALLRRSRPLLRRFHPRIFPALMGALAVFAVGAVAAVVFVIWGLVDIGGDEGVSQFVGISWLGFVNGMLASVLWAAGVQLGTNRELASDLGTSSVDLLTFTEVHGAFWLAPVVLGVVMLTVAVVVVLRQHTILDARLEGLRFAVALGLVALASALLLRIGADYSGRLESFGDGGGISATFNPFLAAFVLALWGAVTGLLAPSIAAGLPPGFVAGVRRRFGMAPAPVPAEEVVRPQGPLPPVPPQSWQ